MEPPRRQVQPQQPAASQVQPQTPSDALPAMPTFSGAPQTPDVGRASTVATSYPAPAQSSLGNPWAATRERMSSATLQVEGACPTSAGLSETSTLPVQRSMGMQSVGAGSVISAQASIAAPSTRSNHASRVAHTGAARKVASLATQKGTTTVLDLLFMTFKLTSLLNPAPVLMDWLPLRKRLKAARTFSDALTTLRTWRQQVLTVVTDLGGNPEPLRLFTSLKTLISSLISSDTAFSTEVSHMYRQTNIKTLCTDTNLLQLMGLLEIELSARAQEDDEERRRKGHANSSSAMATLQAEKAQGKEIPVQVREREVRARRGRHRAKRASQSALITSLTMAALEVTNARINTPARVGKCLRCGAKGHQLASCRRPRRDAGNQRAPSAQPKGKAKPAAANRARKQG